MRVQIHKTATGRTYGLQRRSLYCEPASERFPSSPCFCLSLKAERCARHRIIPSLGPAEFPSPPGRFFCIPTIKPARWAIGQNVHPRPRQCRANSGDWREKRMAGMSSVVLRMGRLQSETSAPATSRREARRIPPRPTRARPTCPSYLPPGRRAKSSRYPPNLKCRMAGVLPRPSCRLGILVAGRSCFLWQLLGYLRRLAVVPRPLRRSVRNDGANRTGVQYNKPQKPVAEICETPSTR